MRLAGGEFGRSGGKGVARAELLLNWLGEYFRRLVYFFGFPVGPLICFCQLLLTIQYSDFIISAPGTSYP